MFKINFHNLKEYFNIALKSLTTRRVRSFLTTIGIIIGVFLIVSLLSLSQGLKNAVLSQLNMMGKDLIMIMPGDISNIASLMGGQKLTEEDIKIIKQTRGVEKIAPVAEECHLTNSLCLYWKWSIRIIPDNKISSNKLAGKGGTEGLS